MAQQLITNNELSLLSGIVTGASLKLSSLTSGRVTFATTAGLLTDSSALTFDGTTLTTTKFAGALNGTVGATTPSTVVATSVTNSGLTSGRVTYAGASGLLSDSVNLTFNGTTLTANTIGAYTLSGTIAGGGNQLNNIIIGTSTPLAGSFTTINASTSITNAGLTSGRVTFAGASGLLSDSANLTFDGSNLGLGVTPSAWISSYRAFNIGDSGLLVSRVGVSINNLEIGVNWYRDSGGSFLYKANGFGTNYLSQDGAHRWYNAPSGTAGNAITFTNAMTLDADGDLGIGATNPLAKLHVKGSGTSGQVSASFILENSSSGTAGMDITGTPGASRWRFLYGGGPSTGTNALTESMCILTEGANAGNLLVGTSNATANFKFVTSLSADTAAGIMVENTSNTVSASAVVRYKSSGSAFAVTGLASPTRAVYGTLGPNVTFMYTGETAGMTFMVDAAGPITFATGSTPTERMRIDSSGNVGIGTTSPSSFTTFSPKLVVGSGSGGQRITIYSGTGQEGDLIFADGTTGNEQYRGTVRYDHADDAMKFYTNGGINAMIINSAQGVQVLNTVGVGNTIPSTSGAGITFPATQSASSNANTLDDYEEGTWTPVANSLTTVGSPTLTGLYTKFGCLVTLYLVITPSTSTTSTAGTTYFTGLPYTASGSTTSAAGSAADAGTVNLGSCAIYAPPSSRLYTPSWTANTNTIAVTITYQV